MRLLRVGGLAALLACTSDPATPAPEPEPEPTAVVEAKAPAPPDGEGATATMGSGEAVDVQLSFYGVGSLYQGFFTDARALGALGRGLGACLDAKAQVAVSYDSEERIGRITLKLPPGASECAPRIEGSVVDLSPLTPLSTALADYRDAISAARDVRVASFRVVLASTRGARSCELRAAGQHPPDGSTFAPCLTTRDGRICSRGHEELEGTAVLRLQDPADVRYVTACFSD